MDNELAIRLAAQAFFLAMAIPLAFVSAERGQLWWHCFWSAMTAWAVFRVVIIISEAYQ